jgi:hypothetical protein
MKVEINEEEFSGALLRDDVDEETMEELDNITYGLGQLRSRLSGTPAVKQMNELLAFFSKVGADYRRSLEEEENAES